MDGFEVLERLHIGHLLGGISPAGYERNFHIHSCIFSCLFYCSGSAQHDQICDAHVTGEGGLNAFQHAQHFLQTFGFVSCPVFLGSKTNTGTVGTSAVIRCSEGTGTIPCSSDQLAGSQSAVQDALLQAVDFGIGQFAVTGRDRILPDEIFLRYIGAEVATLRSHITMGQLEPGTGKGIFECSRILAEFLRDLPVFRIHLHRHISIGHDGVATNAGNMRIERFFFLRHIDRFPLIGTCRALPHFPIIIEQQVEIGMVPFVGSTGPRTFQSAGHRVLCIAASFRILPSETLVLYFGGLRHRSESGCIAVTMCLTYGVSAGCQRNGLFVVHTHALEGGAHIVSGSDRVWFSIHPFRVHIDETHLHSCQWVLERFTVAVCSIAILTQPFFFSAPVNVFFGMPDICTATAKSEGLEAHGFVSHVTGQDHQIGPGKFVAILLFDRPQ